MEQHSINDPGVTPGQGIEPVGQCEDQVPVIDIEEVGTLAFEPTLFGQGLALRAVAIPAGAITDGDGSAVIALCGLAAQRGGAAPGDCPQYPVLLP